MYAREHLAGMMALHVMQTMFNSLAMVMITHGQSYLLIPHIMMHANCQKANKPTGRTTTSNFNGVIL